MSLERIKPEELERNTFQTIGKDWLLLTAGVPGDFNTMTVSWGGLGVLWGRNVATVYVRPQRYTKEFMEKYDSFTLSAYPASEHSKLALCGAKSGRDVDKVAECGFEPKELGGGVYFEGANLVIACRKIYFSDFESRNFLDPKIMDNYAAGDFHRMYIGEITDMLAEK